MAVGGISHLSVYSMITRSPGRYLTYKRLLGNAHPRAPHPHLMRA